ncbi:hypothetical protein GOODEAATRI_001710 [Goodea atripinnis]|uniref:Uncharacterized protein n=1 Tax=Goodea atripinnis TaxID=208336 RepID=A0ABV0N778_9TELE
MNIPLNYVISTQGYAMGISYKTPCLVATQTLFNLTEYGLIIQFISHLRFIAVVFMNVLNTCLNCTEANFLHVNTASILPFSCSIITKNQRLGLLCHFFPPLTLPFSQSGHVL